MSAVVVGTTGWLAGLLLWNGESCVLKDLLGFEGSEQPLDFLGGGGFIYFLESSPRKFGEEIIQFDDLSIFFKWVGEPTTN